MKNLMTLITRWSKIQIKFEFIKQCYLNWSNLIKEFSWLYFVKVAIQ